VPLLRCGSPECSSPDQRPNRTRSSIYLSHEGFGLVIDTSPDFRLQALRASIPRIDAVLITHAHADHIFGMDDLRRFNTIQGMRIPVFAAHHTLGLLARIFYYFFESALPGSYRPQIDFEPLSGRTRIGPFSVTPFEVEHGLDLTMGYRLDVGGHSLAYAPDCIRFPRKSLEVVDGVGTMVLDALRYRPHVSHMTVEQSVKVLQTINAPVSYITHLGHDLDYATVAEELPAGIYPAYDGLRFLW
jgi:phosphoribosyl 1,2-cyclic phosphate phosphodiesterase